MGAHGIIMIYEILILFGQDMMAILLTIKKMVMESFILLMMRNGLVSLKIIYPMVQEHSI